MVSCDPRVLLVVIATDTGMIGASNSGPISLNTEALAFLIFICSSPLKAAHIVVLVRYLSACGRLFQIGAGNYGSIPCVYALVRYPIISCDVTVSWISAACAIKSDTYISAYVKKRAVAFSRSSGRFHLAPMTVPGASKSTARVPPGLHRQEFGVLVAFPRRCRRH